MNNTIMTVGTMVNAENKAQFLNMVLNAMEKLTPIVNDVRVAMAEREGLSNRFKNSFDAVKDTVRDFIAALENANTDMETIRSKTWAVMTSCVPLQEAFCDAKYHGYEDKNKGHLLVDGISQIFNIVHDDAHHFIKNGRISVFRIWSDAGSIVFETTDRDEFVKRCERSGIEQYKVALANFDRNGHVGLLNNPTIIIPVSA